MYSLKHWSAVPGEQGVYQREDGLLVVPTPDGLWTVSHPSGTQDTDPTYGSAYDAMAAADTGGPDIPVIRPGDQWVN